MWAWQGKETGCEETKAEENTSVSSNKNTSFHRSFKNSDDKQMVPLMETNPANRDC